MFFEQLKTFVLRGLALEDDASTSSKDGRSPAGREKTKFNPKDVIHKALGTIVSPHGVPSMVKTLDAAMLILRIARSADPTLSSSQAIDDFFMFMNEVAVNSSRISRQGFGDVKVLCIEGLSCSGKSTLVQGLVTRAGAIVIEPLESSTLVHIRLLFSNSPEPVTTALEYALNYCTAYRITKTAEAAAEAETHTPPNKRLIIVDEFYHRTCSHTVCTNVGSEVDPRSLPASAFEWPLDLPTPSLVSLPYTPFLLCLLSYCLLCFDSFLSLSLCLSSYLSSSLHSLFLSFSINLSPILPSLSPLFSSAFSHFSSSLPSFLPTVFTTVN